MVRIAGTQQQTDSSTDGDVGRAGPRSAPTGPPHLPIRIALRVLTTQALLALVVGLAFLVCYAGLQRGPQPRHLPLAVTGTAAAPVASALGELVRVAPVADDAAARAAVRRGDDVAALSVQPDRSANLYVASANGQAETGAVEQVVETFTQRTETRLAVIDLVPTVRFDPRGLASFYVALSATVASFILSQAMFAIRQLVRVRVQALTLTAFAVVVGTVLGVMAGPVLHVVPVPAVTLVAVLALLSTAVSLGSRALIAWFGPIGITLATLTMTAVGLSTSGGILGEHLLPWPLAALGSVLPPGAGLRALVSLGYFSGRHSLLPLLVLGAWASLSLGALLLHTRRRTAR